MGLRWAPKAGSLLLMATTTNTAGTHSGTPTLQLLRSEWLKNVQPYAFTLANWERYIVTFHYLPSSKAWWSIHEGSEITHYNWEPTYTVGKAFGLVWEMFNNEEMTADSMERLVRQIRFLTT